MPAYENFEFNPLVALATGGCTNDVCCRGIDACPGGSFTGPAGLVGFGSEFVQNSVLTFVTKVGVSISSR